MVNLKTLTKHTDALGVKNSSYGTEEAGGIFVPLERVVDGTAHMIPPKETGPLMKYLKRSGAKWEYRGNYTFILIREWAGRHV